jgi:hypothetical protein
MTKDRQHAQRCMAQVEAYRASGMKAKAWAEAHGVPLGTLGGWCGHYRRWQQALLEGASAEPSPKRPAGFVSARLAAHGALPAHAASVRIEVSTGAARLELQWPLAHARELGALLRELGR